MDAELRGKKIAFLFPEEDLDQEHGLWEAVRIAWDAVRRAGGTPNLLYTNSGEIEAPEHLDKDYKKRNMKTFATKASSSDYDGLALPSRIVNADFSWTDQDAQGVAERFHRQDGPTLVMYLKKRSM